jgi:hypothetical protein
LQLSTISIVPSPYLSLAGFRISKIKARLSEEIVFAPNTESLNVLVRGVPTELLAYLHQYCEDYVIPESGFSVVYGILQILGMLVPPQGWRAYCMANMAERSAWEREGGLFGDLWGKDSKNGTYLYTFKRDFWRLKNRRIFSTTDGSAVLANKDARPDDLIVALRGGTVPFILQSKRGNTNRFLGPCFFFAKKWMDGEAVRYKKENNISDERFDVE